MLEQNKGKVKRLSEFADRANKGWIRFALGLSSIILLAFASFALGRLSAGEDQAESIVVREASNHVFSSEASTTRVQKSSRSAPTESSVSKEVENTEQNKKNFVASESGTRYYLPWCGGVSRIHDENKVWYATQAQAREDGLTPAKRCDGI